MYSHFSRFVLGLGSAALLTCGGFVATVSAQEASTAETEVQEDIVRDIQINVTGPVALSEERVLSLLRSRVGEQLNLQNTNEDIRNLVNSGLVDGDPLVSVEKIDSGIRLIYDIRTRASVGTIDFVGNSVLSDERLLRELADEDNGVGIEQGVLPSGAQIAAARALIAELYRDRGYPDVVIHTEEVELESGLTQLIFQIDQGIRGQVEDIRFLGNAHLDDGDLRDLMQTKKKGIFSFLTDSGELDNNVLNDDLRRIETAYQDEGFLEAQVTEVAREELGDDKINLVVTIVEGPRFTVANVEIDGSRVFEATELLSEVKLQPGDTYSVSDQRSDVTLIRNYYGSQGYTNVSVIPDLQTLENNQLQITYRIQEGVQAYVGRVSIEGNTKTQDRVIRREVPLEPGDLFVTPDVEATRARLMNTGWFDSVDVTTNPTLDPNYEDLNILVSEKSTGTFGASVGVSSIDSIVGTITLGQSNFDWRNWPTFSGAGQKFNASILAGAKRRDIQISFTEPWLFGQKVSFGWDLFYRDLFFLSDVYDQNEFGFRPRLRWPFGENGSLSLIYTAQQVKIDNLDEDVSDAIRAEEGSYFQSSLGLEYEYDTRNRLIFPDEGRRFKIGIENTSLGSDFDATKFDISFLQYVPLRWDLVFSLSGGLEVIDGDAPIFYRSYLGGPHDLRGFDFRKVSPTDETGEPLGGGTSVYTSAELTFPIIERVRGAVFYDVGVNSADSFDFSGDLHSDVGIGVRLDLPVGPLKLDLGFPLQAGEFSDEGTQFHFSVGYDF